MSLTRMARELDMRTIVVDGRERYATRERFPDADEIRVGMPSEIVAAIAPTKRVAVVLIAHDYKYELPGVARASAVARWLHRDARQPEARRRGSRAPQRRGVH
jgi:xanthine dehydrogenase accessory factor